MNVHICVVQKVWRMFIAESHLCSPWLITTVRKARDFLSLCYGEICCGTPVRCPCRWLPTVLDVSCGAVWRVQGFCLLGYDTFNLPGVGWGAGTNVLQERPAASVILALVFPITSQFIHSLVFSLRGWAGRNQSPVLWPVWLWHTASWASSWG